jgi:hypothetical protein
MKKLINSLKALALVVFLVSCNQNDDDNLFIENDKKVTEINTIEASKDILTINIVGLEDLGKNYVYEGWIIVDEKPISTGRFTSIKFPQKFKVDPRKLESASKFVLTIEPSIDLDPYGPSETKVLSGDFSGNSAKVNSNIIADFSSVSGQYKLEVWTGGIPLPEGIDINSVSGIRYRTAANPTPSGIWFGTHRKPLDLPTLPKGWRYEGWVKIKGSFFSTGTFTKMREHDDNFTTGKYRYFVRKPPVYSGAPQGAAKNGPRLPGEDFTKNAPKGFAFPTDLRGASTFISVEPFPDNDECNPFIIKPLSHKIPAKAVPSKNIDMNIGSIIKIVGTVSR